MDSCDVNGLPLPSLLVELLRSGQWQHPGDKALKRLIPFLREPVDFLMCVESMRIESPKRIADDPKLARIFHFLRESADSPDLPWLDVNRAVFIAVNRVPGDDLGIALDYRTNAADPRVVASDWDDGALGCRWREVAPCFSVFFERLAAERAV